MAKRRINIVVLTSSRADFSIYLPLLNALKKDKSFSFRIIAFGSHTSKKFGNTYKVIESKGFKIFQKVSFLLKGDTPADISSCIGKTVGQFGKIWSKLSSSTDLM